MRDRYEEGPQTSWTLILRGPSRRHLSRVLVRAMHRIQPWDRLARFWNLNGAGRIRRMMMGQRRKGEGSGL